MVRAKVVRKSLRWVVELPDRSVRIPFDQDANISLVRSEVPTIINFNDSAILITLAYDFIDFNGSGKKTSALEPSGSSPVKCRQFSQCDQTRTVFS